MSTVQELFAEQINESEPLTEAQVKSMNRTHDLFDAPVEAGDRLLYALVYRSDQTATVEPILDKSLDQIEEHYDFGETHTGTALVRICEKGMTI